MTAVCVHVATETFLPLFVDSIRTLARFSSVLSLDGLGRRGDMRDDSAEILFQSFLREALLSSSGIARDVHYLMSDEK